MRSQCRRPSCGTVSSSIKQRITTAPKDLPYGRAAVKLLWHKRRWRFCPQQTFTETVSAVPARARSTVRLRAAVAEAVGENRCVAEAGPACAAGRSLPGGIGATAVAGTAAPLWVGRRARLR
jgi:transposase